MKWEWLKEYQVEHVEFEWLVKSKNPRLKPGDRLSGDQFWDQFGLRLTFMCYWPGALMVYRKYSSDKIPDCPTPIMLDYADEGIIWRVVAK
jgi:hypothetical protein